MGHYSNNNIGRDYHPSTVARWSRERRKALEAYAVVLGELMTATGWSLDEAELVVADFMAPGRSEEGVARDRLGDARNMRDKQAWVRNTLSRVQAAGRGARQLLETRIRRRENGLQLVLVDGKPVVEKIPAQ